MCFIYIVSVSISVLFLTEGDDYTEEHGTITFVPNGPKSISFPVPITDDHDPESNEPLRINFSSDDIPPDMQIDIPTPNITIIDNDIGKCVVII